MSSNRSVPSGTFLPLLNYMQPAPAVLEWFAHVFQFTPRLIAGDDHAQMSFNGGGFLIGANRSHVGESDGVSIVVRVNDVDAMFAHIQRCGVQALDSPTTHMYGERQFNVRDLGGHVWTFSQTIQDTDPTDWGAEGLAD